MDNAYNSPKPLQQFYTHRLVKVNDPSSETFYDFLTYPHLIAFKPVNFCLVMIFFFFFSRVRALCTYLKYLYTDDPLPKLVQFALVEILFYCVRWIRRTLLACIYLLSKSTIVAIALILLHCENVLITDIYIYIQAR